MANKEVKKGRNSSLIQLRNKKLIERYYYWTEKKRRRFDDVLEILSLEEFFLTEPRIIRLLNENNQYLNEIIKKNREN